VNARKKLVDELPPGLYEQFVSKAAHDALKHEHGATRAYFAEPDPEEAHYALAQYIDIAVRHALGAMRGEHAAERQVACVNKLLGLLQEECGQQLPDDLRLELPLKRLVAVQEPSAVEQSRPDTPLSRSALLTGTRADPALAVQLQKEIANAERVDILCSFIKWSGLRLILDQLKQLTATPHPSGPRLRVITTSYMGATDPRAVEALRKLPNTEVRVSYDTSRTRLHAKAYIIHRATGFGSAYVGSANLSRAAISEGLEWTNKVSQYELPYLWHRITATFDTYWNEDEFEPYTEQSEARLREAIEQETHRSAGDAYVPQFDLRPYPFQEEILEAIEAERTLHGKFRHLIVAATGTGKTMVAAFDYKRWCSLTGDRPRLLFVAHREEILRQALAAFRTVLRDQNFGDLVVGGMTPAQADHHFCSIQTYNARDMHQLEPGMYDYVVVDEFHHAAAPSYRRLLDHVRPRVLLGLTATPERADGLDILQWFGGKPTAQIRLPDAIHRRLLCPFQYFGLADSQSLEGLTWQRGGYRISELEGLYDGNYVRARLIVDKIAEYVLSPRMMRGIGFCVSVKHAEFMAGFCNQHGLPAMALSAESGEEERLQAQDRLRRREVNIIFVVDLYNEGVDIPEIDTVLFLRPTESLTVFLQQLGRGLRLHEEKDCLTVLDFIGAHRKEFKFAPRIHALTGDVSSKASVQVEAGFPQLPPGCAFQLERVAQERVLANLRQSVLVGRRKYIQALTELGRTLGRRPKIGEAFAALEVPEAKLLAAGTWSQLLGESGLSSAVTNPDEDTLSDGFSRIAHFDDPNLIDWLLAYFRRGQEPAHLDRVDLVRLQMLYVSMWRKIKALMSLEEADARFKNNPSAVADLIEFLEYRRTQLLTQPREPLAQWGGPLSLHSSYTRDEILIAFRHWDLNRRPDFREGTLHLKTSKIDAMFVTLHKTLEAYSQTTMYEDYAITDRLFHWQSQSTVSDHSETAARYFQHAERGYTPLLFVREFKDGPAGSMPYIFLGDMQYRSHEGSKPVSIVWELHQRLPARLMRTIRRQ
jgi:superfamily II DNA or RNA helicase